MHLSCWAAGISDRSGSDWGLKHFNRLLLALRMPGMHTVFMRARYSDAGTLYDSYCCTVQKTVVCTSKFNVAQRLQSP